MTEKNRLIYINEQVFEDVLKKHVKNALEEYKGEVRLGTVSSNLAALEERNRKEEAIIDAEFTVSN